MYVLLKVGCLECSEPSEVMGVWQDTKRGKADAEDAFRTLAHDTGNPVLERKEYRPQDLEGHDDPRSLRLALNSDP